MLILLALGVALAAPPHYADEAIIARVGDLPVRASDVRRLLPPSDRSADARDAALREAVAEAALAVEARARLGERARGLARAEAAALLLAEVLDPAVHCARLPRGLLERRYATTRWRFVAPPAWEVDDIQLLCCTGPRACQAPEVARCLQDDRETAAALRTPLPDHMDRAGFLAAFDRALPDQRRLGHKRYVFYYDPSAPDAPVDGRLQEVDAPVARAVARLAPGEVSPVVETRFGHHVLRLRGVRPAIDVPFEDPRTQAILRTELCGAHLAAVRARYVADLLRPLGVTIDREALERSLPTH